MWHRLLISNNRENGQMTEKFVILYCPVGQMEFELIRDSEFKSFPPRLAHKPIFYPVLTEQYAVQIARDWMGPRPCRANSFFGAVIW